VTDPWLRRDWTLVLRDRNVLLITGSYFFSNYVFYFFFNWLYIYMVDVRKFEALRGGAFAAAPWIVGSAGAVLGGMVCDQVSRRYGIRWGPRLVSIVGLVLAGAFIFAAGSAASPYIAVVLLCLCLASQQFTDSAAWAATMMVGGRHASAACGVLNTGGNVIGGINALLVPITARALGWPSALGIASVFALLGAILWIWIETDRPAGPGPTK
jgi:sugar phosphate permease